MNNRIPPFVLLWVLGCGSVDEPASGAVEPVSVCEIECETVRKQTVCECWETDSCVLVVTRARKPGPDDCIPFPTPCDVPEGWVVCEPEPVGS